LLKDTFASVGWGATASFNALIIAPGEVSPALTKCVYRSCVMAKNAGCWSAGIPMRVARDVRCSPCPCAISCARLSKLMAAKTFAFSYAQTWPSLVQPDVPLLMPKVPLPKVPLVVASNTWTPMVF